MAHSLGEQYGLKLGPMTSASDVIAVSMLLAHFEECM